jgi:hypothetical protein
MCLIVPLDLGSAAVPTSPPSPRPYHRRFESPSCQIQQPTPSTRDHQPRSHPPTPEAHETATCVVSGKDVLSLISGLPLVAPSPRSCRHRKRVSRPVDLLSANPRPGSCEGRGVTRVAAACPTLQPSQILNKPYPPPATSEALVISGESMRVV